MKTTPGKRGKESGQQPAYVFRRWGASRGWERIHKTIKVEMMNIPAPI